MICEKCGMSKPNSYEIAGMCICKPEPPPVVRTYDSRGVQEPPREMERMASPPIDFDPRAKPQASEVPETKRKQCNRPQAPGREWPLATYECGSSDAYEKRLREVRSELKRVCKELEQFKHLSDLHERRRYELESELASARVDASHLRKIFNGWRDVLGNDFLADGFKAMAGVTPSMFREMREARESLAAKLERYEREQWFGEYRISPGHEGTYWIEHESGEGMGVDCDKFNSMIEKWYKENF